MTARVLVVDDDPAVRLMVQEHLHDEFEVDVAASGAEALRVLRGGTYAVVAADMRMPGEDGVDLLAAIREEAPDTVRVLITGYADLRSAIAAVNRGHIFRLLTKPIAGADLRDAIRAAARQHHLVTSQRELMEKTVAGAIAMLTEVLAMLDPGTFSRCLRMRELARLVATEGRLPDAWELEVVAMLAPIGMVAVPHAILAKARLGQALTGRERDMLARVPETGYSLLRHIPRLEGVAEAVRHQRARFDGPGEPSGSQIPLAARLVRILGDLLEGSRDGADLVAGFSALESRSEYDPELVKLVRQAVLPRISRDCELQAGCEPAWVGVRALVPGQVLMADVFTREGTRLVVAGQTLTHTIIERLKNFAATVGVREPIAVQGARIVVRR